MDPIQFANLTFRGLRRSDLLSESDHLKLIVTVNAEMIVEANRNKALAGIISEHYATFDGQWPFVLARWRTGRNDFEKISGSDFVYELCQMAADKGLRVFLLGARPSVNAEACNRLHARFGGQISGFSPPPHAYPLPENVDREILKRIEDWNPAILVVCFGAPKQELWLQQHREALEMAGVRWAIGAGGTLDFVAGVVLRAPRLLQRCGLESLWRVALEPRLRFSRLLRAISFFRYA